MCNQGCGGGGGGGCYYNTCHTNIHALLHTHMVMKETAQKQFTYIGPKPIAICPWTIAGKNTLETKFGQAEILELLFWTDILQIMAKTLIPWPCVLGL